MFTVVSVRLWAPGIRYPVLMPESQVLHSLSHGPSPTLIFKLCTQLALQAVGLDQW